MRTMIPSILILFLLLGSNPALAQLPPEIAADARLLRAEQAIRDGDTTRARAEIDKIILLQKEHELDLSEEFHFRAAKAAAAAGLPERALESIVKYLTVVGRGGPRYVEALELMNQAQDEIAGRTKPQAPVPGPPSVAASQNPIEVQSEKRDQLDAPGMTLAESAPKCDLSKWNTKEYFKMATVEGVKACLVAGADMNARDEWEKTPLHWAASDNKNPDVAKALLAAGADVNARDRWKTTPLHLAARNRNPAMLKALLAAGADQGAFVGADNRSGAEQISMTDAVSAEAKKAKGVDSYYTLSGSKSVTNPVPLAQPTPSYTKAALNARAEGTLWLQAVIRKTGKVDGFKVISWPNPGEKQEDYGLVESAIKEISENWRFKPGMIEGKPVDVVATIEVRFNLHDHRDSKPRSLKDQDQQMRPLKQIYLRRLRAN